VSHRFGAIAALGGVAVNFLNPLQINDRHYADQQVYIAGDVDLVGDDAAV